jgi:hypothetical protein
VRHGVQARVFTGSPAEFRILADGAKRQALDRQPQDEYDGRLDRRQRPDAGHVHFIDRVAADSKGNIYTGEVATG